MTPATHDHEPMASLWNRWRAASEGFSEKQHLLRWIGWDPSQPPDDFTPELHTAMIRKVLSSTSNIAIFTITDLFAQTQRFNIPGPMSDSNWTERLTCTVQDFDHIPKINSRIQKIESLIQETGRNNAWSWILDSRCQTIVKDNEENEQAMFIQEIAVRN